MTQDVKEMPILWSWILKLEKPYITTQSYNRSDAHTSVLNPMKYITWYKATFNIYKTCDYR